MYELTLLTLQDGAAGRFRHALQDALFGGEERDGASGSGLWSRLGVERPVLSGTSSCAGEQGIALQLFDWVSFEAREQSIERLWHSEAWRNATTDADRRPLVTSREHWLMDAAGRWSATTLALPPKMNEIVEVRIEPVLNGQAHAAAKAFWTVTAPLLSAAGARVLAQFQISVGPPRPTLVTFLAWDGYEALHEGWRGLDPLAQMREQRMLEIRDFGRPLFSRARQMLIEPIYGRQPGGERHHDGTPSLLRTAPLRNAADADHRIP